MRVATKLAIVLIAIALCAKLSAKQTAVTIDLTEQMAYLLEDGRVTCVSPIASGKEGCGTPVGSFRVIGKDLNHQSGSFGLISNADGGIVNPNATPGSYVPPGSAPGSMTWSSRLASIGFCTVAEANICGDCFSDSLINPNRGGRIKTGVDVHFRAEEIKISVAK